MSTLKHLFSPVALGTMKLESRLVMPPMTIHFGVDEDGNVTEQHWEYHAARAAGGTEMITVGGGAVHPSGIDLPRMPRIWADEYIPALRKLVAAVKKHGAKIGMQLLHGGRQAYQDNRVAPSPLPALGVVKGIPRELTPTEIEELITAHGDAAVRCQKAGFDYVEIHAAHGYLISEFLAPLSNKRTDQWGGSFEKRTRFLIEILRDIKSKTGRDYPVGVRYNGDDYIDDGWTLPEAVRLGPILEKEGADWLHISAGIYGSMPVTIPSLYSEQNCFVHLADAVKKAVSIPVITVGRIKDPRIADKLIAEGQTDLVAMGRAHIADPELATKAREERFDDIRPCIGCCRGCIDSVLSLQEATCVMNPAVGREYLLKDAVSPAKFRRVLVIGSGPAGLSVARRAALRGHEVIVVERDREMGGATVLAGRAPHRSEMMEIVSFHHRELKRLGVEIRVNTKVDEALLERLAPDVAVLATGAQPEMPQVEGLFDTEMALHTAQSILRGEPLTGNRIILLGGGMIGLQTADYLLEKGNEIVAIHRGAHFAEEMSPNDRTFLRQRLKRSKLELHKNVQIMRFLPDGVVFQSGNRNIELSGFTDLIVSEKMRSNRNAANLFETRDIELHIIGDAKNPRENLFAIAEGDEVGRLI